MIDNKIKTCYNLLTEVMSGGAFGSISLDDALKNCDEKERAYITRLFYGVLEKSIQFDYIISKLTEKKPKNSIVVIIKIGLYFLNYMNMPDYAAINTAVELAKSVGKGAVSGLVNGILRNSKTINLPEKTEGLQLYLSVKYGYPLEIVGFLLKQYDAEFLEEFFAYKNENIHIRRNSRTISREDFEKSLDNERIPTKTGYYVTHNTIKKLFKSDYTIQSLASTLAVHAYLPISNKEKLNVLDLCGAPAGKSIYMQELIDAEFTVCDIHEHRVQLIDSYAKRMKSDIRGIVNDATVLNENWINKYDIVICDVPCSGLGLKKPDLIMRCRVDDILSLCALQKNIIDVAKRYVKVNGFLNYSTCTITKQENENVVNDFLAKNPNFKLVEIKNAFVESGKDGFVRLFPQSDNCDGFFVAKLQKVGELES